MSYVRLDDEQIVHRDELVHAQDGGGNTYMLQSESFQQLLDKINDPSKARTLCSNNNGNTDDVPLARCAYVLRRCIPPNKLCEHLQNSE